MICPRCKNEKLNEDVCPKCGLNQKKALLSVADSLRTDHKTAAAIECYDKFLRLEPNSLEVSRKRALCICSEAISQGGEPLFENANKALRKCLEDDWEWEEGHQHLVNIFSRFGKLTNLQREYERISAETGSRKAICEKIIKIIQLTEKFKNESPLVPTIESHENALARLWMKFWPLLIGAVIILLAIEYISSFIVENKNYSLIVTSLWAVLGFSLLGFLVINVLKKKRK